MAYILVFEGDLTHREGPEEHACHLLPSRLSEALPIPVLQEWADTLRKAGTKQELITRLTTDGDSQAGYLLQLAEPNWAELISRLLKEEKIGISLSRCVHIKRGG